MHVFCEKPLVIDPAESRELSRNWRTHAAWSPRSATTTASSAPSRRSSAYSTLGAIGPVNTALAEAYGPVVLKPVGPDLAQPAVDRGRMPLRLRRASARIC